jgi:hypothetical protein
MQDTQNPCSAFAKLSNAIGQVIRAEVELGQTLVRSLAGATGCSAGDSMMGLSRRLGSSCEIPSPCWAPQYLGDFTCTVSPRESATFELQLENRTLETRPFKVGVAGYENVVVTPGPEVNVPALQRQTVRIAATIPQTAKVGESLDLTVVVIGCRIYYLHWNLRACAFGLNPHHRIVIKDGPDNIHHWYDHFYAVRPCMSARDDSTVDPSPGKPRDPVVKK